MRIVFNKITANNFMCFEHEELDLANIGIAMVSGVNNNPKDGAKSNGSGKSSIFNAICYALTGETSQGLKNGVENLYGDPDDCWVELDFNIDRDHYIVKRYKTPKTDLKIYLNDKDISGKGIRESTAVLAQYIPDLTSELLSSIIILGQGLPNKFTDGQPAARKEKLEKLTKSDFMIQYVKDKLDERQSELDEEIRPLNENKLRNKTKLDMYESQINKYTLQLNKLKDASEITVDDLKNKLDSNTKLLEEYKAGKVKNSTRIDELLKTKDEVYTKDMAEFNNNIKPMQTKLEELRTVITQKTTERDGLKTQIAKYKAVKDTCPTCGQKLPGVSKIDTTQLETDLEIKNAELKVLVDEFTSLNAEITQLTKDNTVIINDKLVKINSEATQLKEQNFNYDLQSNKLEAENKVLNEKISQSTSVADAIKTLNTQIEEANSEIEKVKKENIDIEALLVVKQDRKSVVSKLIGLTKKEFRGILLLGVIDYINAKAKQFSRVIFRHEGVNFELNENAIEIKLNDKHYEALSGGEKQKVDIIIQLALRDLISSQLKIHSNLLVCDEVFDNLDSIGCQRLLDLISTVNDVESMFVISHHADELQMSYDCEVIIEKGADGLSKISIK